MSSKTYLKPKIKMEEIKNVPEIRFNGFNSEWERKSLSMLANLGSSKRVHREDYVPKGIPFFRGTEISKLGENTINEDLLYISNNLFQKLKNEYGVPQKGDILITAVGTIGNAYLIEKDFDFYFKDGNLIWISNIEINNKYLSTFLKNGIGKKRVLESAIGSNQKALTMDKLGLITIDFPELKEQKAIGTFFQNLDNSIKNHNTQLKKLTNLKKAMLIKMFPQDGVNVPEIRFKGFDGEWEEKSFSNIINLNSGRDYKHLEKGGIPVYGTGGYMLSVNEALSYDENAIGIGRKGTIDKPYILKAPFWTVDTLFYAIPIGNNDLDFINCLFQKTNWKQKDESTGVPSLSKVTINNTCVSIPKENEQKEIGSYFRTLDSLMENHKEQLKKLNQIKKACLSKLFISQD
ncbi:hypothetical protein ULMA_17220 [Patiriisocius marinus]|uniref:Type I restriction modification DNA specificity domain-containing protein n=2 Tax=Patiriisocius marinus TaxID=1397112 RepID=A0A5J4IXC6_9FLAO|nr:hypothetical protein ULMA_17220 [Patiriisocius marinus]